MPSGPGGPSTAPGGADRVLIGRPQLEGVEVVGGFAGAIPRPGFDRVGGGVEQLGEPRLLAPRELAQDVVDGVAGRARRSRPGGG